MANEQNKAVLDALYILNGLANAIHEMTWQAGSDEFPQVDGVIGCAQAARKIAGDAIHAMEMAEI